MLMFYAVIDDLRAALSKLEGRVEVLEKSPAAAAPAPTPAVPYTNVSRSFNQPAFTTFYLPCSHELVVWFVQGTTVQQKSAPAKKEEKEDDDDFDPFGSDDDDEEAEKIKEQRLKEYAEKKAKKPAVIAKSSILLDVKPVGSFKIQADQTHISHYFMLCFQWDDETDMAKLEECVRSVQADGLLWGTSKLVPVGYGIKKLQIACVVEDDKVGTDMLDEEITKFVDYVSTVLVNRSFL